MSSTTPETLAWPAEWSTSRARWYLALAWPALLGLASFGCALGARGGLDNPAVKYFALFGTVFALTAVAGFDSRIRRHRGVRGVRTAADATGCSATVLPYSWLAFAGSIALAALMALLFVMASSDLGASSEDASATEGAKVFGAIAVLFLIYPAQALLGFFARGRVLLTPVGSSTAAGATGPGCAGTGWSR